MRPFNGPINYSLERVNDLLCWLLILVFCESIVILQLHDECPCILPSALDFTVALLGLVQSIFSQVNTHLGGYRRL